MNTLLKDFLPNVRVGIAQEFKNLVLFPLFTGDTADDDYLTLTEALEQKRATITEVGVTGSVPHITVENLADCRLLLVDGEELIGAKQNRVLNTSILLKPHSASVVPVSCTEAGRWRAKSTSFGDAGYVSPHKLRRVKSSSVSSSLKSQMGHKSDQHAVWNEVACLSASAHFKSPTSSLHELIQAKEKELAEFLSRLQPAPNQRGLAVLVNDEVAGLDILSSPRAYGVLHSKFIKSYAMDALLEPDSPPTDRASEKLAAFFEESRSASEREFDSVACGKDHRFETPRIHGSALVDEGRVIHLNLYRN
jgi:hypothetical protein